MDSFKELLIGFKDHMENLRNAYHSEYEIEDDVFSEGYDLGSYLAYSHAAVALSMLIDTYEKEKENETN